MQPRSSGSSTPAPAVARCFVLWRYPVIAGGGFGVSCPRPFRGEDSEAFPRSGVAQLGEGLRHSERLVRFRDPSPTSASSLRSQTCVSLYLDITAIAR